MKVIKYVKSLSDDQIIKMIDDYFEYSKRT